MVALVSKDILNDDAGEAVGVVGDAAVVMVEMGVEVVKEVKCWASCWRRLR